jgi:hypothetical protein
MSTGQPLTITIDPNLPDTPEGRRQGTLSLAAQLHDCLIAMGGEFMDKDAFLRELATEMDEKDQKDEKDQNK